MLNEEIDKIMKLTPERRKTDRRNLQHGLEVSEIQLKRNKEINNGLYTFLSLIAVVVPWIMGIVLANGIWLKTIAIFFPPYAWYLIAEKLMLVNGLL